MSKYVLILFYALVLMLIVNIIISVTQVSVDNRPRYEYLTKEGEFAYRAGVPAEANPYTFSSYRVKWLNGWMNAKLKDQN